MTVSTNSVHPVAAVDKRLFTGQVKNEAQHGQLSPLWTRRTVKRGVTPRARGEERRGTEHMMCQKLPCDWTLCRTWYCGWWPSLVSCIWKDVSPFSRRLPLTSASLQSLGGRAPGGERWAVIHGDIVKLHGCNLPFYSGKDINLLSTLLPRCLMNTDEKLTVLNKWEEPLPQWAVDASLHHPPAVI